MLWMLHQEEKLVGNFQHWGCHLFYGYGWCSRASIPLVKSQAGVIDWILDIMTEQFDVLILWVVLVVFHPDLWLCWYRNWEEQLEHRQMKESILTTWNQLAKKKYLLELCCRFQTQWWRSNRWTDLLCHEHRKQSEPGSNPVYLIPLSWFLGHWHVYCWF